MDELFHRGFRASIFVRRSRGTWEVLTTIYVPEGLVHELGDQVIMDVDRSPTNASSTFGKKRASEPRRSSTIS